MTHSRAKRFCSTSASHGGLDKGLLADERLVGHIEGSFTFQAAWSIDFALWLSRRSRALKYLEILKLRPELGARMPLPTETPPGRLGDSELFLRRP